MAKRHHMQIKRNINLKIVKDIYDEITKKKGTHEEIIRNIIMNIGCTWIKAEEYLRDLGLGET